jgi:hypothetical protein
VLIVRVGAEEVPLAVRRPLDHQLHVRVVPVAEPQADARGIGRRLALDRGRVEGLGRGAELGQPLLHGWRRGALVGLLEVDLDRPPKALGLRALPGGRFDRTALDPCAAVGHALSLHHWAPDGSLLL